MPGSKIILEKVFTFIFELSSRSSIEKSEISKPKPVFENLPIF